MINEGIIKSKISISPKKMYKICKKIQVHKDTNNETTIQKKKKSYMMAKPFQMIDKRYPKRGSLQEDITLPPNLFLEEELKHDKSKLNESNQKKMIKNWVQLNFPAKQTFLSSKTFRVKLSNSKGSSQIKIDNLENKRKGNCIIEISKEMAENKFRETLNRLSSTQQSFVKSNDSFALPFSRREEKIFNKYRTYKALWNEQE